MRETAILFRDIVPWRKWFNDLPFVQQIYISLVADFLSQHTHVLSFT